MKKFVATALVAMSLGTYAQAAVGDHPWMESAAKAAINLYVVMTSPPIFTANEPVQLPKSRVCALSYLAKGGFAIYSELGFTDKEIADSTVSLSEGDVPVAKAQIEKNLESCK